MPASSTATTPAAEQRLVLGEVEVVSARRLSPTFLRLELGGECLADVGVDGPTYDQRIKLVVPGAAGTLPTLSAADADWYAAWCALPEDERGHMRTYTVRDLVGEGAATRVVVDVALHGDPPSGPGAAWAASARPGDRCLLVGPRRGVPWGGIEFAPSDAEDLLLVADETGVPAVAAILAQLPPDARGVAFLEVPVAGDVQLLRAPDGVDVRWLVRSGAPWGARAVPAVRRHVGLSEELDGVAPEVERVEETEETEEIWETPLWSETEQAVPAPSTRPLRCYAWIAGESTVVRTLRRALVSELGWDRAQVAFMGYWREGVSMRS